MIGASIMDCHIYSFIFIINIHTNYEQTTQPNLFNHHKIDLTEFKSLYTNFIQNFILHQKALFHSWNIHNKIQIFLWKYSELNWVRGCGSPTRVSNQLRLVRTEQPWILS